MNIECMPTEPPSIDNARYLENLNKKRRRNYILRLLALFVVGALICAWIAGTDHAILGLILWSVSFAIIMIFNAAYALFDEGF